MIALADQAGLGVAWELLARYQYHLMLGGIVVSSFVTYTLPPRSRHVRAEDGRYSFDGQVWRWTCLLIWPLAWALYWLHGAGVFPLFAHSTMPPGVR